jgi:hypothetical protein
MSCIVFYDPLVPLCFNDIDFFYDVFYESSFIEPDFEVGDVYFKAIKCGCSLC